MFLTESSAALCSAGTASVIDFGDIDAPTRREIFLYSSLLSVMDIKLLSPNSRRELLNGGGLLTRPAPGAGDDLNSRSRSVLMCLDPATTTGLSKGGGGDMRAHEGIVPE